MLQAFEKHIKNFYASPGFKEEAKKAEPFFKGVKDYVFGRPTTLENIVRLLSCIASRSYRSNF